MELAFYTENDCCCTEETDVYNVIRYDPCRKLSATEQGFFSRKSIPW